MWLWAASCSLCSKRWPVKTDHFILHIQGVYFTIRLSIVERPHHQELCNNDIVCSLAHSPAIKETFSIKTYTLSLCLIKHHVMKIYKTANRQFHTLTFVTDGGNWSTSCPSCCFTNRESVCKRLERHQIQSADGGGQEKSLPFPELNTVQSLINL